ncbi:exported hypothetical protein [Methylocella tundrae]|jgi:hypothetical protein|uniref:Uncharacterized protein n=1 Tax=Methylocella tundrae TaxID=227605 RepID=A0A8B6M8B6_METTU|nr:hypothetical protein [Methylocella tundrae]VTZ26538.1 exported hypothetical protein [Methylocella tundrae]VTZ50721.1 exported hypothetical protein [Methylocella tundrae]
MKMLSLAAAALALAPSATVINATRAYAAPESTYAMTVSADNSDSDWATSLVQENEGIPNPNRHGRCMLMSRPVSDGHGRLLGYHTFNVCS